MGIMGWKFGSLTVASCVGLALLIGRAGIARAQSSDSSESVTELKTEVSELKQEVQELKGEMGTLKKQEAVAAPEGTPPAAPKTVGEHVGAIEKDVSDIKKNLSDNLGVHVHGLTDVTYGYNINHPQSSGGSKGGPNPTAPGGSINQLREFDTNANGWTLEQFNIHIDKSSDGGVGFLTDLNFGQVADVMGASTRYSNLNPTANATTNTIVDPTQAYLTYTAPFGKGINLQLGRMVTLLGAEVIPVYNNTNFNESRGFLFTLGEPLTHTGLRGNYAFNDKVSATLGVNNGWDDISDNNDGQTVEGELSMNTGDLMPHNQSLSLVLNGIYGPEQVNHGSSTRWAIDPILTYKTPIKGLQLISEYLYAEEGPPVSVVPAYSSHGNRFCDPSTFCTPAPGFTPGPQGSVNIPNTVSWTGTAGYIVYDWNDNLEFATRGEYFRDADGARSGMRQTLGEITETINYKIPAVNGLLARLEYRHDESGAKPFFSNETIASTPLTISEGVAGLPVHTYAGQDTFLVSAIYAF
ncbi:MAG TPA: outer membrane beta-barrel protein [Candidatus Binataceae bacterium]|nr:outer membrane beta-barrel protein [Candidatus Binataceae bacterium]